MLIKFPSNGIIQVYQGYIKGDLRMKYRYEDFLFRIKKVKKEKKLRIDDIISTSDIPRGTLSKILSGITTDPKVSTVVSLADALGVSVDYLVYGKDKESVTAEEEALIYKYRQMDCDDKEEIDAIIDMKYDRLAKKGTETEDLA